MGFPRGEEAGRREYRVLVLDDIPEVADLAAAILGRNPVIDVRTETDPRRAVERSEREPLDCLVSDYQMPGMDGLTVCRRARSQADVRCIVFTSVDDPALTDRVRAEGFGYVHKNGGIEPYERLAEKVERHVAEQTNSGV